MGRVILIAIKAEYKQYSQIHLTFRRNSLFYLCSDSIELSNQIPFSVHNKAPFGIFKPTVYVNDSLAILINLSRRDFTKKLTMCKIRRNIRVFCAHIEVSDFSTVVSHLLGSALFTDSPLYLPPCIINDYSFHPDLLLTTIVTVFLLQFSYSEIKLQF